MNQFGGDWTKKKIEILVRYAESYLRIMNRYPNFKLMYFDGFAGSGFIKSRASKEHTMGAAKRIIELDQPKRFDIYYFVEKSKKKANLLRIATKDKFPKLKIIIRIDDCNNRLHALANYLKSKEGKKFAVLAYIDPCGMQLKWQSLEMLKGTRTDIWVLVPTGLGVNRLLKRDGNISDEWLNKLIEFLGISSEQIISYFYPEKIEDTLFGSITYSKKLKNAIDKSAELYRERLKTLFKFVTQPFVLTNKGGTIMYHLFLASNYNAAYDIANFLVKKFQHMK